MIRMMANVNWRITNNLRGVINAWAFLKVPFNTFTGWKEERKNAG